LVTNILLKVATKKIYAKSAEKRGHIKINCTKSSDSCIYCKRARRSNDRKSDLQHAVRSLDYPKYKRHLEIYKNKIKWS